MLHRHLFAVVTTDNNTEPSQIPDNELVSFDDSLKKMMYIAVVVHNMSGDQWEKMVVLGGRNVTTSVDGSSYYNAPLKRENTYYTFVRAYAYDHNDRVSSSKVECKTNFENYRTQDTHPVTTQSQLVSY